MLKVFAMKYTGVRRDKRGAQGRNQIAATEGFTAPCFEGIWPLRCHLAIFLATTVVAAFLGLLAYRLMRASKLIA